MKWIVFVAAVLCGNMALAQDAEPANVTGPAGVPHVAAAVAIEGRDTANPGDLVVLKGTTATAKFRWVYDKEGYGFDALQCGTEKTFAFSASKPGRYIFWLVAEDGEALGAARHVVTVGKVVSPPPKPDDPPGGDPGDPVGDLDKAASAIATRYTAAANALKDPATVTLLVAQWKAASGKVRGSPDIPKAGAVLAGATEAALAQRKGLSRYVDWLNKFRKPLNEDLQALIDAKIITTPADLDTVIQALTKALE